MKNKEIVSAILGSTFFAVPYLALSVTLVPSLLIGCAAFGASELVLSGTKPSTKLKDSNRPLYLKISEAKIENKEIKRFISNVERIETRDNLNEIHDTVDKIIDTIEKKTEKVSRINNFFDYYLPVLIKIISRYDEIENQKLVSIDGREFLKKADKMIEETNKAFKMILASLYQKDIMDIDADMKVYDMMLKADGITGDNLIMKGSENDEK